MTKIKDIFKKIIIYILRVESKLVLMKYKPKVVAITGSVGKTSTKDAVYAVISDVAYVRKSQKSYNSEIGLSLTILGAPNGWDSPVVWAKNIWKGIKLIILPSMYPKWLILEVGVDRPGDIKRTASWLKTDAVIITAIGETPSHIEFFKSRKHLIEEKAGLIKTLRNGGILILNADDEAVIDMKSKTKHRVVTYGFKDGADMIGSENQIFYDEKGFPKGISYRIDEKGKSFPVITEGVFGKNHVYASLAALALASGLKLNMLDAINRLKKYEVPAGRMRLIKGINESLIIDDTYNSSPMACETGLKTMGEVKNMGRKIAVLGDMLELGKHTKDAHEQVGKIAKDVVDFLIVVGQRALSIKTGALDAGMDSENIFDFGNSYHAGEFLKDFIKKNDLIFFKGSQGIRMERAVEQVMQDKDLKLDLLVRQDPEWIAKE